MEAILFFITILGALYSHLSCKRAFNRYATKEIKIPQKSLRHMYKEIPVICFIVFVIFILICLSL
ncbi:hypothetical protein KSU1_C1511 [Candidatus Jettenia caeni]|uniref:Uncharacterized protein n=1 Tax=Candidatus Jettenia caeni TaxID=247490 RepID=I3IN12_9BACT|nr:hypothetical protein KSU1_C1511 [Candidatus Jettenia caeni]